MSDRDTQFQGFAKLLMRDLDAVMGTTYASLDKAREAYELVIARRAYDLARHVALRIDPKDLDVLGFDDAIQRVPDMHKWAKEQA